MPSPSFTSVPNLELAGGVRDSKQTYFNKEPGHLYALDLTRFIAAMAVLVHHWGWVTPQSVKALAVYPVYVARYGYLGVELFFLISGLVILMSARTATLESFVAARVVRLYPAFWICCTITFCILLGDPQAPNFQGYLVNMTMFARAWGVTFVDGSYWTLALEAKFYLLVAVLLMLKRLDHIEVVLWVWLGLAYCATNAGLQGLVMAKYAAFFVGGCACQLLSIRRTLSRWALFVVALCAGALNVLARGQSDSHIHKFPFEPFVLLAVVGALFLLVLSIAMRWVRLPPARNWLLLGAMSYPIYLLHKAIGYQFFAWTQSWPWAYSHSLALTWVLLTSYAVVRWGERPLQHWLRRQLTGAGQMAATAAHAERA